MTQVITAGLWGPRDVAVDPLGRIAVADSGNDRVRLLDASGVLVATWYQPDPPYSGPFNDPRGVAIERIDRIVVADTLNWRIVTVRLDLPRVFLPAVQNEGE